MTPAEETTTYAARWVFPVDGAPLEGGSVTVRGERIASVQAAGARTADVDLGNVALLPGFVNAHTHLDLCGAHGRCPPTPDFTAWLRQVIAFRRSRTPEQVQQDIAAGISACLLSGTTLVGDISSGGASWDLLARAPIRATVYYELIGLTKERAEQSIWEANCWLGTHRATETCRPGLSPHAPYSVRRDMFRYAARMAELSVPVAVHLAESRDEMELLQNRTGPLVAFLRDRGVWDREGLVSSPEEVVTCFRNADAVAFIHGNYLRAMPDNPTKTVVRCPRTNSAFGRGFGPFSIPGFGIAFGTDSLASNPDLDVLAEARLVFRQMKDSGASDGGAWCLQSITWSGTPAMDLYSVTGSLTPGKSADMVVLPLPDRDVDEPHELIFDSELTVRSVMFRGQWVVP